MKERVERSAEETERLQTWLKSAEAKEFVRQSPELKDSFSSAATAAKTVAKEQAEALSAEESALGKIKSQLTAFASSKRIRRAVDLNVVSLRCV